MVTREDVKKLQALIKKLQASNKIGPSDQLTLDELDKVAGGIADKIGATTLGGGGPGPGNNGP